MMTGTWQDACLRKEYTSRHVFIGLTVFIAFAALAIFPSFILQQTSLLAYYTYDIQRGSEILLLSCITLFTIVNDELRGSWLKSFFIFSTLTRILIGLFFGLALISSYFAAKPFMALMEVLNFYLLFHAMLFLAGIRSDIGDKANKYFLGFIICSVYAYLIFYFVIDKSTLSNATSGRSSTVFPGFVNIRFFGQYQLWSLVLIGLPLLTFKKYRLSLSLLLLFMNVCWWGIMEIGYSRAVILSLLLSSLVILLCYKKKAAPLLLQMVSLFLAGLLASYPLIDNQKIGTGVTPFEQGITKTQSIHSDIRFGMWAEATAFIKANPLLGVGPMHLAHEKFPSYTVATIHNTAIKISAEYGLPAALILFSLFIMSLVNWVKKTKPTHLNIALTFTFVSTAIYSLASAVVETPMSQVMGCLVLGWMLGIYQHNRHAQPVKVFKQRFFQLGILSSLCMYLWLTVPQLYFAPELIYYHVQRQPNGKIHALAPNFWVQGIIR